MTCKICNDQGWLFTTPKEITAANGKRHLENVSKVQCLCLLNKQIPQVNPILTGLPDITLQDQIEIANLTKQFIIFHGKLAQFQMLVKAWLTIIPNFNHGNYLVTESNDFFQNFFMPNKTCPEEQKIIADNRIYKHLFLLFTSVRFPPAMKEVMAELVKDRVVYNKPCWLYCEEDSIGDCLEYSTNMDPYLNSFVNVNLSSIKFSENPVKNLEVQTQELNESLSNW